MKFEYHTFDVEPYLASRVQPSFAFPRMAPAANYYTLTDPETGEAAFTRGNGAVVRIPVFGVSTQPLDPAEELSRADHGSLLTALGMEVILKFVSRLPPHPPISRAVVVLATACHSLPDARYRAYLGIALEVESTPFSSRSQ